MKTKLIALSIFTLTFVGCAQFERVFYRQRVTEQPGRAVATNAVFKTNIVVVAAAATNVTTGEITPPVTRTTIEPRIEIVFAPPTYVTNLVPRAEITTGLDVVGGAAPFPYAGTIAGILGALIGGYASWQNRKNQALAGRVTGTLVENFEQLRKTALTIPGYTSEIDHKVMDAVKSLQSAAGVKNEIHAVVEARTENTV